MDHSSGLVFCRPQALPTAALWSILAPPFSSVGQRPAYAYRTLGWKAIARGSQLRRQEVYNLSADPGETKNLVTEQTDTSLCLATLLRHELNESRPVLSAGEVPELSSDDMDALRSLGYVL